MSTGIKSMIVLGVELVVGQPNPGNKQQIFSEKPHSTWDNFFSGDNIMDWLGRNGFGATMTCRRDRLPVAVSGHYMHKKKTLTDLRSRVARFHEPVVMVKDVPEEEPGSGNGYQRIHTSFQSTSSCNISMVNALNRCSLFVRRKGWGVGDNKRCWEIEMNDARDLYLRSYYRIDCMDHLIKNAKIFYRSWKYWHAPMRHGKAMAIVVAYDMYLEVCEGKLDDDWKVEQPVDFWRFRELLS